MRKTIVIMGPPSRWMRPGEYTDPKTGISRRITDKKAEAGKKKIADEARLAYRGERPATGPVLVHFMFVFAIPKSWPPALIQAAHEARVMHIADPDLDQLVKQCKDALKGIAYVDDNQVCGYHPAPAKRYGGPERTEITIQVIEQRPDEITPGQRRLERRVEVDGWDAVLSPPKRTKKSSKADTIPETGITAEEYRAYAKTLKLKPHQLFGRGRR